MHKSIIFSMLLCMRTTMDINDELMRLAKQRAATEGTSLKSVVERALRAHLSAPKRHSRYTLQWRTERGRLQPGVDLNDRDSLFERMEDRR